MDFLGYSDYYDSYVEYQTRMLEAFDQLGEQYGFQSIDASQPIDKVFTELCTSIELIVTDLKRGTLEPSNSMFE